MDTGFSPEQDELRRTLRRFLTERSGGAQVRRAVETPPGHDEKLWRQLCDELGLPGLLIPEQYGGLGLTFVEAAVVGEELGRALCPSPYLASAVLAASVLLHAGDPAACADYLPGIAEGTTLATFAHRSGPLRAAPAPDGSGHRLDGEVTHVLDGHAADLLVLPVGTPGGVAIAVVAADAPGLSRERLPTLDQTRAQARLRLDATPARLVASGAPATAALARVGDLMGVALAAEAVGGAARCLEMAVEYAKTRVQFGRPIGTFQAIKHRCADLYVEVESARSAAYYAAWCAAEGSDELPAMAAAAQAYCAQTYRHVAGENIQLHGGIGFTWEHDAHLYFKRATSTDLLFGTARHHRARLAEVVLRPDDPGR